NNPTLVRDTLFAIIMILLGGMVGVSLLAGGWRHREQHYNLQGANAYLSVIIPLALLTLSLPNFTVTTPGPTLSVAQQSFLVVMSLGLYAAFLAIQTGRHRGYFILDEDEQKAAAPVKAKGPLAKHAALLVVYILPVVFLAGAPDRLSDRDAQGAGAAWRRHHRHAGGDAGGHRRHPRRAGQQRAALDQYFSRLGVVHDRAYRADHVGDQLLDRA